MKPKHTGPYIIIDINPDGCSATIEHLYNGHIMKAHFTNLQVISFHAGVGNRVDRNFDDRLTDMLSKKTTLLSKSRRELDIPIDFETPPNTQYATQEDEIEIEEALNVDKELQIDSQHPDFGQLKETENFQEWEERRSHESQTDNDNSDNDSNEGLQQSFNMDFCSCEGCQKICPFCEFDTSVDLNDPNWPQHPFIIAYKEKLKEQIEQNFRKISEGKLLVPSNNNSNNTTLDSNNSEKSLWLSDSYNLLHHNGRVQRTQARSTKSNDTTLEDNNLSLKDKNGLATQAEENQSFTSHLEYTPISEKGEPNETKLNGTIPLVDPSTIEKSKTPAVKTAAVATQTSKEEGFRKSPHRQERYIEKKKDKQLTPYPSCTDLTEIDDLSRDHLSHTAENGCHTNNNFSLHSSISSDFQNELTNTEVMEQFQKEDFIFAPDSNRTSTPYPTEFFDISNETNEQMSK
jgi:hypothetical protein